MKIEAGKSYTTRNGKKVDVTARTHRAFPIEGAVDGKLECWMSDGAYRAGVSNHPLDLVGEWYDGDSIDGLTAMYDSAVKLDPNELMPGGVVFVNKPTTPTRTIYLSGPMKGYPARNYPLFNTVASLLRGAGHRVYNPAEFGKDRPVERFPIREAFAEYSKFICEEADAIVLLPGWEASKGANAERALADNCGLQIIPFEQLSITV